MYSKYGMLHSAIDVTQHAVFAEQHEPRRVLGKHGTMAGAGLWHALILTIKCGRCLVLSSVSIQTLPL